MQPLPRRRSAGRATTARPLQAGRIAELAWAGQHEQAIAAATVALAGPRLAAARQVELLEQRAKSHSALGDHARAAEDAQAMLGLARQARSASLEALALCRLAAVHTRVERYAAAAESAQAAVAAARKAQQRALEGQALLRLSEAQFRQFDNGAALRHALQAAAIFEGLGDSIWQGRALWAQAYAHDQMGQARERDHTAARRAGTGPRGR